MTTTAKFDKIMDLEQALKISVALGADIMGDAAAVIRRDRARLYAALEALTPAEVAAFGTYRAAQA